MNFRERYSGGLMGLAFTRAGTFFEEGDMGVELANSLGEAKVGPIKGKPISIALRFSFQCPSDQGIDVEISKTFKGCGG